MRDIFELLNEADMAPIEQRDVKLTKKEQDRIFQMIMFQDKKKRMGKSIKKALVSAAVLAIIVLATVYMPILKTIASNILTYFTENTKTDYAQEIHENVEQDMGTMELMSVSRADGEIYLRVKFTFAEDITGLADLCRGQKELGGYMVSEDGRLMLMDGTLLSENCTLNEKGELVIDGEIVKADELIEKFDIPEEKLSTADYNAPECYVLDAPPFQNSSIIINGMAVEDWMASSLQYDGLKEDDFPIEFISARNIEISEDTLIQDVVLTLRDADYAEDIEISFRYKDIELSEKTLKGEWNLDYTISSKDYKNSELNRMPIELSATDLNGAAYTVESYSVTPGGIKIYGQDDNYDKMTGVVRITAYDELGNKYLMYPSYEDYPNEHYVYTIYDGPADINDEYLDRLDENAKTLTIAFEQLYYEEDENGQIISEQASLISDKLTLNIDSAE